MLRSQADMPKSLHHSSGLNRFICETRTKNCLLQNKYPMSEVFKTCCLRFGLSSLKALYPNLVSHPDPAGRKLAAGWLIDKLGGKGTATCELACMTNKHWFLSTIIKDQAGYFHFAQNIQSSIQISLWCRSGNRACCLLKLAIHYNLPLSFLSFRCFRWWPYQCCETIPGITNISQKFIISLVMSTIRETLYCGVKHTRVAALLLQTRYLSFFKPPSLKAASPPGTAIDGNGIVDNVRCQSRSLREAIRRLEGAD